MTAADPVQCARSGVLIDPTPTRHLLLVACPDCHRMVRPVDWTPNPRYAAHAELNAVYPSLGDALARHYGNGDAA